MSDPFEELQLKQDRHRFEAWVIPPCFRAMMWSISKVASSWSWWIWQYSQQWRARCQTNRTSAASMSASGSGSFLRLDAESTPGLRLEDAQQTASLAKGDHFL